MSAAQVETLLVVGLGLIGGSLAAALRGTGFAHRITAFNRRRASLDYALRCGYIDAVPADLDSAIAEADLIVIGVPTLTVQHVFERIRACGKPGVIMTDVASVKGSVVESAERAFGSLPAALVPGHPIAGAEHSGVESARATLFQRHRVILTPHASTAPAALELVTRMWRLTGADVHIMSAAEHDRVLAMTSHLPHMLAFALVEALSRQPQSDEIFRYAAGGFRDFTRIASSDAVMWRDIALANRVSLCNALDMFSHTLAGLRASIAAGDAASIEGLFEQARGARERYLRSLESDASHGES
jgi:prephenate dehydrogenase